LQKGEGKSSSSSSKRLKPEKDGRRKVKALRVWVEKKNKLRRREEEEERESISKRRGGKKEVQ
jgi:hypothetical protein